ncbi:MAG: GNAT family N-acetyltransferase [Lentisphaerae bacterium]|nr:GNAT family N-acetyltransferase [Lentisphaerota bacterium]
MLEIATFNRRDIPAALRLCEQVNWNHVAADWERCLALNPEACLGGFEGGELKATCTLTPFGTVGWVGTFLVDQTLRGKGYGKMVFAAMLETARRQGIECLGLDSSDAGRPIYLKHGFRMTDQGIELWTGPAAAAGRESHADARPFQPADWGNLLAFDRACVKLSREKQLRTLAAESGASIRVIEEDGALCAFGFSRPGRLTGTIGPVVALDTPRADRIVSALMADRQTRDGGKPVGLAILDNAGFKERLAGRGFQMRRRNIRMFHPEPREVLAGPAVFAATGLGMA